MNLPLDSRLVYGESLYGGNPRVLWQDDRPRSPDGGGLLAGKPKTGDLAGTEPCAVTPTNFH